MHFHWGLQAQCSTLIVSLFMSLFPGRWLAIPVQELYDEFRNVEPEDTGFRF